MSYPFGKMSKTIVELIANLQAGKRVLYLSPNYVVIDSESYRNLILTTTTPPFMIHYDEEANFTDENYEKLQELLKSKP